MTTLIDTIHIYRGYGAGSHLQGTIKFRNARGDISVNLDASKVEKLVAVVADLLVETAQDTAKLMVADVLEQAASLPAPAAAPNLDDGF